MRYVILLLLLIPLASAHLDGGTKVTKDGYLIDFGYSPDPIRTGDPVLLNVILVNATTDEPVTYDSAWIRISDERGMLVSATLSPTGSISTLSYSFPSPGTYDILVRFDRADGRIVHTFPVDVTSGTLTPVVLIVLIALLSFISRIKKW